MSIVRPKMDVPVNVEVASIIAGSASPMLAHFGRRHTLPSKRVWAELRGRIEDPHVIRSFKNRRVAVLASMSLPADNFVAEVDKAEAAKDIRAQVFARDHYACTHCGRVVSWESGELHERRWRGRGGEMSLENSTTLCYDCHSNDPVAGHGKRKPQFTRSGGK